jgi:dihydrofolate reductase
MNMTLDGYVAARDGSLDWMFGRLDDELAASNARELSEVGTFLMGRRTYEGMAAHWPNADDSIAELMNRGEKVVFSSKLTEPEWENTRIASGPPEREIADLKRGVGGTIAVAGGAQLARAALATGLVDEVRLLVHPVVLGDGMALFARPMKFDLLETERFGSGVVAHTYRVAAPNGHR